MNAPEPTNRLAAEPDVRRPPTPLRRWATVTHLGVPAPRPAPVPAVQGTLALDLIGCSNRAAPPDLEPVAEPGEPILSVEQDMHAWAGRFAQAVVEVLGGDRPLPQLLRWTTDRVYSDLGRRVRVLARTAPARQRLRTVRPQVRSVHVFQPRPDCAEVSVHVRHGHRSRALAARIEVRAGRWQCTALQLG